MKMVHSIYDRLISLESIYQAWQSFRSGKTDKKDIIWFENHLEDNLFSLQRDLEEMTYKHGPYKEFVVNDPKRRQIHKAEARDRIVHTLVARELEVIYQPIFISESYACQDGRGIHRALKDLVVFSRWASKNYQNNFWYLKCDIRKFFENINHTVLLEILQRKIKDDKFIWLVEKILLSFPRKRESSGIGLPLGNFTSQWLANVYLNELDYFIKHTLHLKYYLRYADDFLILDTDRDRLKRCLVSIGKYLQSKLQLKIHRDKVFIKKFSSGIDWVGYRVLPHYVILKKRIKKKILKRVENWRIESFGACLNWSQYRDMLNSYLGWLKHCQGKKISDKLIFIN